jgi:hypothetical protein
MMVEVSNGEIVDKVTILKIKSERITDRSKLENINKELNTLLPLLDEIVVNEGHPLFVQLYEINSKLWEIEDEIRVCEKEKRFGGYFIELARSVYQTNDLRFEVKKEINLKTSSNFVEEKSYQQYI